MKRTFGILGAALLNRLLLSLFLTSYASFEAPSADAASPNPGPRPLAFEADVRPILKAYCFGCHGETAELKGGLDVRLVRFLAKGGESGPVVVPGDRAKSLLFQHVAEQTMPPGEKKLTDADVALIGRWIDEGAKTLKPEPATLSTFTDEEREFWSFQPIRRAAIPRTKNFAAIRSPIDAFLLAELEKRDSGFSEAADAATLCRRAYVDLLGLTPTPDDVEQFVASAAVNANAWDELIDRLLASPHYGERWGRHWLDVAGYADSDGYTPLDAERKYAYKYRDYVIRAMNDDKPWNEIIVEQLAGDELVGAPVNHAAGEAAEKLIATGFLRMAPDGTGDPEVNQPVARNDVMAETIKVVSSSLLGLTVGCAQCHSHRYDPITAADYYRFRAIFEPAFDWKNWRNPKARLVSTLTPDEKQQIAALDADIKKATAQREAAYKTLADAAIESELQKVPADMHDAIRKLLLLPPQKRSKQQVEILKKHPGVNVSQNFVEAFDRERYETFKRDFDDPLEKLKAQPRPVEEFIHAATEVPGKVSPTMVFFRGDHNQPREVVAPGELSILLDGEPGDLPLDDPAVPTTGRRLAYAKQLTNGRHPLVARVLVNRFWMHHFGRGLVGTPSDFGYLGDRPTHPELLDWLAADFMDNGWQLKRLHKLLMSSTAYRQTSRRTERLDQMDPNNLWLGRASIRRMDAETLRDSVLAVSGALNTKMFGRPIPVTPNESGQIVLGVDTRDGAGRFQKPIASLGSEALRRSLYVQMRRSYPLGVLETFDAPEMTPNCTCRACSTVTLQSLLLMNSEFITDRSEAFAKRLQAECGDDVDASIRRGWELVYGTPPTERQFERARHFVTSQTEMYGAKSNSQPTLPTADLRSLTLYCQSLLSANGFLYVD